MTDGFPLPACRRERQQRRRVDCSSAWNGTFGVGIGDVFHGGKLSVARRARAGRAARHAERRRHAAGRRTDAGRDAGLLVDYSILVGFGDGHWGTASTDGLGTGGFAGDWYLSRHRAAASGHRPQLFHRRGRDESQDRRRFDLLQRGREGLKPDRAVPDGPGARRQVALIWVMDDAVYEDPVFADGGGTSSRWTTTSSVFTS